MRPRGGAMRFAWKMLILMILATRMSSVAEAQATWKAGIARRSGYSRYAGLVGWLRYEAPARWEVA